MILLEYKSIKECVLLILRLKLAVRVDKNKIFHAISIFCSIRKFRLEVISILLLKIFGQWTSATYFTEKYKLIFF